MITGLARLFGSPPGVAMRTGLNLAQAGEFGFVLLNLILDKHLVEPVLLQAILSSMLLSMLAAPFIIQNADRIVLRLSSTEWLRQSLQMTRIATQSIKQSGHVIICGYGRAGQNLARMLEHEGLSYVALDLDRIGFRRPRRRVKAWCTAMPDGARRWSQPAYIARPRSRSPSRTRRPRCACYTASTSWSPRCPPSCVLSMTPIWKS